MFKGFCDEGGGVPGGSWGKEPKLPLVLFSALVENFSVSRMRDFFYNELKPYKNCFNKTNESVERVLKSELK